MTIRVSSDPSSKEPTPQIQVFQCLGNPSLPGTSFALLPGMMASIRLLALPEAGPAGAEATVNLCFGLETSGPQALEAILYARRCMLREEWTRGREADEPLLEDALFSSGEILWRVRADQKGWCLQKVDELMARARRWLAERERSLAN